ncbi:hypothetical protein [Pontibacter sp. G13]|uniref:hypothetical protein n=1 Tax=Pontibacter sp. G13 TaxID=3074898 RepID=UPI00288B2CAB|nr:hypothetical protein [Pontibacter sp. G13]WNJ21052.1 hypothetical protein RJD25_11330 [Pontibacter sp. G13]
MSFPEEHKFEIHEVDVVEHGVDALDVLDDLDPDAEVRVPKQQSRRRERQDDRQSRRRRTFEKPPRQEKKPKYGWAFFLCSLFTGIGITAVSENPLFLFLGLGFGFLFFVDPLYEKVMSLIDRI